MACFLAVPPVTARAPDSQRSHPSLRSPPPWLTPPGSPRRRFACAWLRQPPWHCSARAKKSLHPRPLLRLRPPLRLLKPAAPPKPAAWASTSAKARAAAPSPSQTPAPAKTNAKAKAAATCTARSSARRSIHCYQGTLSAAVTWPGSQGLGNTIFSAADAQHCVVSTLLAVSVRTDPSARRSKVRVRVVLEL